MSARSRYSAVSSPRNSCSGGSQGVLAISCPDISSVCHFLSIILCELRYLINSHLVDLPPARTPDPTQPSKNETSSFSTWPSSGVFSLCTFPSSPLRSCLCSPQSSPWIPGSLPAWGLCPYPRSSCQSNLSLKEPPLLRGLAPGSPDFDLLHRTYLISFLMLWSACLTRYQLCEIRGCCLAFFFPFNYCMPHLAQCLEGVGLGRHFWNQWMSEWPNIWMERQEGMITNGYKDFIFSSMCFSSALSPFSFWDSEMKYDKVSLMPLEIIEKYWFFHLK